METHYPTIDDPATPEYVLAVLQDMRRQEPDRISDTVLSFTTTTAEWRSGYDLLTMRELGRAQNSIWGLKCSDVEWRSVLEPRRKKTMADVCAFIGARTSRPRIRPARLFGSTCVSAGAFLTVRSLLHQAGAWVEGIAPSTPLAPYARRYYELFLGPISRIAPGSLPLVSIIDPVNQAATWGLLASLLCLGIGVCGGLPLLGIVGVLLTVLFSVLQWISVTYLLPASVTFGELETFRDLANVIAQGDPT
jgi:hypothetical protein